MNWGQSVSEATLGDVVAIDGIKLATTIMWADLSGTQGCQWNGMLVCIDAGPMRKAPMPFGFFRLMALVI